MATWITICNLTKYDAEGAFAELGTVDWKQSTNIEAGDIVYVYVSKPIGGIKFKCRANKVNLTERQIDDSKWVLDGTPYENYGKYMELELLHKFDTVIPTLEDLQQKGIKAILGPLTVNPEAYEFLKMCEDNDSQSIKLKKEELTDDIVVIKINKSYKADMSELELYEVTRGVWKRKIESVSSCQYCLSVANSIVVEVYKISAWYPAGTIPMQTRNLEDDKIKGRIEFVGEVAEANIRNKYLGKSVADLYKMGEGDPVKVFLKDALKVLPVVDINTAISPILVIATEETPIVICPNCENRFSMAPRCPECGQLIAYKKDRWNKPKLRSLQEWADAASITGAEPKEVTEFVEKAVLDSRINYYMGAVDMSLVYEDKSTNKVLKMLLLFGKERCGAIQPSSFYDFVKKTGLNKAAIDQFLKDILPFLSVEQKNRPYERINGYYFIDYFTIIEKQDELLSIFKTMLDNL